VKGCDGFIGSRRYLNPLWGSAPGRNRKMGNKFATSRTAGWGEEGNRGDKVTIVVWIALTKKRLWQISLRRNTFPTGDISVRWGSCPREKHFLSRGGDVREYGGRHETQETAVG